MSKIMIAGGTGFLGSNTARAFIAAGIPVVITTRKNHDPVADALAAESDLVTVEHVNLTSAFEVFNLFSRYDFEGLAITAQSHLFAGSRSAIHANYQMIFNCMEAATATGVKRCVMASQIGVYHGQTDWREDMRFPPEITDADNAVWEGFPIPKFEVTLKRALEMIMLDYGQPIVEAGMGGKTSGKTLKLPEVVALRFPAMFGPGYSVMGSPISRAAHVAAGKDRSLIDGAGYNNIPVQKLWEIISVAPLAYVRDSADAMKTAMLAESLPNRIYNVNSGFVQSPRGQLEALYRVKPESREWIGLDPESLPDKPFINTVFSSDRLLNDLGWTSGYSLETAIEDYLDWLQDHPY
jgi:nucleoside-diphosphate-sugar epimerase